MSQLSSFVSCPNIQLGLTEAWFNNQPLGNVNLVRFLLSDINKKDTFQRQLTPGDGKLRSVELVYGQRFLESSVGETARIACSGFSADGETSKVYEIDPTVGANKTFSMTLSSLQTRCEADELYLSKEILKAMNVLIQKMETDAAIAVIANSGNFATDVDNGDPAGTTTLKTTKTKTSGGAILTDAIEDVAFENMANDFTETPYIFGGAIWEKYARALGAACCGDLGVNAGVYKDNSGVVIGYSQKVQANAANANDGYALIPGAVQMVTFNEFGGSSPWVLDDDSIKQGTLIYPDPALPLVFDYYAKYTCTDANTKVWDIGLGLAYDFMFLPADMFAVGDRLEGVNGVLGFRVSN